MMNRAYRLIWNEILQTFMVASEHTKARGKRCSGRVLAAALAAAAGFAQAGDLPTGGTLVSGQGSLVESGSTLTVNQLSATMQLDWQSFSIAAGNEVNFVQPGADAVALNRVLGNDASQIFGSLNANGQVFLVNPNGILFGPGAQVDVGGLVASTLQLDAGDVAASERHFRGDSAAAVANQGQLVAHDGYIALLGREVSNTGVVSAQMGAVAMGAGEAVTLRFDGSRLLDLQVDAGAVGALANNGGLLRADGGRVLMSAATADGLLDTVLNNEGVVEARTLENQGGVIRLLGGANGGTVQVAGRLDASAAAGAGGHVETSGAFVKIADDVQVTTLSAAGVHGEWLIDPVDFTIAATDGDVSGSTLSAQLASGNVTILSTDGAGGVDGDIHVNDEVSWSADTTLTLSALRNINVNSNITATGNAAGLVLTPDNTATGTGDYVIADGAAIALSGSAPVLVIGGVTYTVINNAGGTAATLLQNISADLAGNYALGDDVDLSGIANFAPIGGGSGAFTGVLAGLGHNIDNLTITATPASYVGLVGQNSGTLRDFQMLNANVGFATAYYAGAVVGLNNTAGKVRHVDVGGSMAGVSHVGGAVGINYGVLADVDTAVAVVGSGSYVGGIVGYNVNSAAVSNADASGSVSGASYVGGAVGINYGFLTDVDTAVAVVGSGNYVGGIVGYSANSGGVSAGDASGSVSGSAYVGGVAGASDGAVSDSSSQATVSGTSFAGALLGGGATAPVNSHYSVELSLVNGSPQIGVGAMYDAQFQDWLAGGKALDIADYLVFDAGSNSYLLGTQQDMQHLLGLAGNGTYRFLLANDIDLDGLAGFYIPVLAGQLDGGGHRVVNLSLDVTNRSNIGLFGRVLAGGAVTNLGVAGSINAVGGVSVGGLVGYSQGAVSNAHADVDISGSAGDVGGLVGTSAATLSDVYATGDVAGANYVGGLAGRAGAGVTRAYATGNVSGSGNVGGLVGYLSGAVSHSYAEGAVSGSYNLGGLVGYADDYASATYVYATGAVAGSSTVGGLVGYNLGAVNNAYASGAVSGTDTVGGLVGRNGYYVNSPGGCGRWSCWPGYYQSNPASLSSAFWDTQATGQAAAVGYNEAMNSSAAATGLTTSQALVQANYVGWNFSTVWWMADGATRPLLRAEWSDAIGNAHQLQLMAMDLSANYTLASDLDLSAALASVSGVWAGSATGFAPVGNGATPFTGSLDGNDRVISNLLVNTPAGTDGAGLFGVMNGQVGNLGLLDAVVTSQGNVGALAGVAGGSIDDVYVRNVAVAGQYNVGALVGMLTAGAQLTRSLSTGAVDGGVAGTNAGGLVGLNSGGTMADATSSAAVVGGVNVGGLVGYNQSGAVVRSYSTGAVAGMLAGGLVGTNTDVVQDSYWDVASSGQAGSAGGTGLDAAAMRQSSSFAGWDFAGTWRAYDGHTSPLLRNFLTPLTVTVANTSVTYDGTTHALQGATYSVAGAESSGHLFGLADAYGRNAGVYAAPDIWSDQFGYDIDMVGGELTVDALALTLSGVGALDKVYDGTTDASLDTALAGLTGVLVGDSLGFAVDGLFADKHAGLNKAVLLDVALTGADAGNYVLASTSQQEAQASITAATVTVSGITAADKVYDGATAATLDTAVATLAGEVAGDDLAIDATGAFDSKHVGLDKVVTLSGLTLTGADAGNYVLAVSGQQATTVADVSAATVTVSGITAADKVYDGTTAVTLDTTVATLAGEIAGDDLAIGASGTFDDRNAGTGKTVTLSGLALSGADAGNYVLAASGQQATTTADIGAATVTVSGITAANKVYDGTTAATLDTAVAALAGEIAGDDLAIDASGTFDNKNVGTGKTVTLSGLVLTGTDAGNYVLAASGQQATTTADISAATVTISGITADDKVYDGTTAATLDTAAAALAGEVAGDDLAVDASGTFDNKNVGTGKTVTLAGLTLTGTDAGNYVLAASGQQATTTADVSAATVTVSGITAADRVYDGTTAATLDTAVATLAGEIAGDDLAIDAGGVFDNRNVGVDKVVTLSGLTLAGADAGNYVLAVSGQQATALADVTAAPLQVTADAKARVYGESDPALTYAVSGVVATDIASEVVTGSLSRAAGDDVGAYAIGQGSLVGNANYSVLYTGASFAITPATLTATVADATRIMGAANPEVPVSFSGYVNGDSDASIVMPPTVTTSADIFALPGEYALVASGAVVPNYTIQYIDGVLTVVANDDLHSTVGALQGEMDAPPATMGGVLALQVMGPGIALPRGVPALADDDDMRMRKRNPGAL